MSDAPSNYVLSDLTPADVDWLQDKSRQADAIVRSHTGKALKQSTSDLGLLQRVLDADVLTAENLAELEALGVAFGNVLVANVDGLEWAIVDDNYGRDATVRYMQSSIQVTAVTMILKRVEADEAIEMWELYDGVIDALNNIVMEGYR